MPIISMKETTLGKRINKRREQQDDKIPGLGLTHHHFHDRSIDSSINPSINQSIIACAIVGSRLDLPTQFSPAFHHAIFIAFSTFKIPWREL